MGKKEWRETSKFTGTILAFGIVLGCICINFLWRIQDTLFENDWAFTLELLSVSIKSMPYFPDIKTVLWMMVFCGGLFLLGFSKYGKVFLQGLILSAGFLTGGIETIWLLDFNLKEGLIFLGIFVVKFLFLITMIGSAAVWAIMMSNVKSKENLEKKHIKKYIFYGLVTSILSLVYIIIRYYVNL